LKSEGYTNTALSGCGKINAADGGISTARLREAAAPEEEDALPTVNYTRFFETCLGLWQCGVWLLPLSIVASGAQICDRLQLSVFLELFSQQPTAAWQEGLPRRKKILNRQLHCCSHLDKLAIGRRQNHATRHD
jgi:hypothetical protein